MKRHSRSWRDCCSRRRLLLFAVLLGGIVAGSAGYVEATEAKMISLDQLQKMFADIKAKTNWNLDGPLLWGYFFTDPDREKLEAVGADLAKQGYRLVDIHLTRDGRQFVLHVEKTEHHTPDSLDRRNQDFYALAEKFHLRSYDGMDVGPLTK
jgi:hypothetical protein